MKKLTHIKYMSGILLSLWLAPVAANPNSIIAESESGGEVEIASRYWGLGAPTAHFYRARGSEVSPEAPLAGDLIGGIGSRPWDGNSWSDHSTAAIHWVAAETIGESNQGTWLRFLTTPSGSDWTGRKANLQISPSGYLYYKVGTAQAVKSASSQSLPNAAYAAVSFDSEAWDNRSVHSSNEPTKLYAQQTGKYQVEATLAFTANSSGVRLMNFRVNGDQNDRYGYQSTLSIGGSLSTVLSSTTTVGLVEGDYVEVYAYQNSGTNVDIVNETGQSGVSRFGMRYVGD